MGFKFEDHIESIFTWKLDSRVEEKVKDTCLYKYVSNLRNIWLPSRHMKDQINSYDATDKSFSINGKKIYLGLEDVFFITGLPIKGRPVTVDESLLKDEFEEYFGLPTSKGTTFSVPLLKEFESLPEIASDDRITKSTRAYLLYILGCVIFPSSWRKFELPYAFLHFVKNVEDVDKYAWGAAVLANTHNALKRKTQSLLGANGLLLSIFMMVHIPSIVMCFPNPNSWPLCLDYWNCNNRSAFAK
ncbi:protein MAIN-LIKE 2-like [Salvia miltiorrhiza]|uniref:protein MAIN-LIKE 2-like n=1 Tax=Salvia miltiorrhiza TaxID=226208 RepID=UPI0025AD8191|nr:protein MAIN-LIKE 2-like [Salvia miltiorrhiza]